jgi:anti-sigma factor RsiW
MTTLYDAHPDEGTIHAWLDRQLDATSSATLEAHLQRCDECAERVAEARGLIAGTSRILAALDDERGMAAPILLATPAPLAAAGARAWRTFRVTPARAAIAATIIIAIGIGVVHERTGIDTAPAGRLPSALPGVVRVAGGGRPTPVTPAAKPTDHLLDSAVARNLAQAQPPRTVEASPTRPATIHPPVVAAAAAPYIDTSSALRVAAGRNAVRAQRDTTVGADLARVAPAPASGAVAFTAPVIAGKAATPAVEATQCLRVETATGSAATWGPVSLPLVIALDAPATSSVARVLTADGADTHTRASWRRGENDSLLFTLRRLGYAGSLALGQPGDVRAGVMRSRQSSAQLSELVTTAAPATAERAAQRRSDSSAPKQRALTSAPAHEPATSAPAEPVVARRIACPNDR